MLHTPLTMGFGEDLLSTGYELFRFAEIVGERRYDCLDEITDKRIQRTVAASETVKGMLYGLHRHFAGDPELLSALASVKRITDYLLFSFQSALAYKQPYAEHTPFGLSVDVSKIDKRKQCKVTDGGRLEPAYNGFEILVLNTQRLVSMQMLMVHYFSIEFVILVAHIHGCRHSPIMLDLESDDKFQALMRKLHKYQRSISEMLVAFNHGGTFDEPGQVLVTALSNVVDLDLTFIADLQHHTEELGRRIIMLNDIPLMHRQFSFNCLMLALGTYEAGIPDNGEKLYKYTENMYLALLPPTVCFPRRFMESNPRDRMAKKFKTFTTTPCNEYQAKPTSQSAGRRDYILNKEGGQMDVQRRKVVKIWKHELKWTAEDWLHFTVIHGETNMMVNLMFALAPIVLANHSYRTNHEQDSSIMHSMLTRFYGPVYAMDCNLHSEAFKTEMQAIRIIDEPTGIQASSIQPMPTDIQKWAKEVFNVYGENAAHHVSDAVFAPVTNLGVVNQLRQSNVRADQYNVRWLRFRMPPDKQSSANAYKFMNSMFLIHYGNALVALQPPHACHGTLKVLGATPESPLLLDQAAYEHFNLNPVGVDLPTPVRYTHSQKMIADILKLQLEFKHGFDQRGYGFLHPACWLKPEAIEDEDAPYVECDSQDIMPGVRILLPASGEEYPSETDPRLSQAMHHMNCEVVEVDRGVGLSGGGSAASSSSQQTAPGSKLKFFPPYVNPHKGPAGGDSNTFNQKSTPI